MSVKLEEIAKELNLSISTISRVVNKKPGVKEKTRLAVQKAIKQYDYSPNLIARSLKTNQTKTIGVVVPDITEPFFGNVIKGINEVANKQGYSVIFCDSDEDHLKEAKYLQFLKETRVDGLVVATVNSHSKTIQKFLEEHMPIVFIDNIFPYDGNFDSVAIDNRKAGYAGTQYLIDKGHKNIGLIAGKQDELTGLERLQGYLLALEDARIPIRKNLIQLGDFKENSGYEAMKQLLVQVGAGELTAVFVSSFQMTYGAMRAIQESNMKYQKDIALVGFDITDSHSFMPSGITSVIQPERNIGMAAARALFDRIEMNSNINQKIVLDFSIIERESV